MINRKSIRFAAKHIHGFFNDKSSDEARLHRQIKRKLMDSVGTHYHFHFNQPITNFGVPSKTVRVQDCRNEFVEYVMNRCHIDESEAIALLNMIDTPVRTNALKLDIAKTNGPDRLVAGLESNRNSHYTAHGNAKQMAEFAKAVFNDMVKEMEIRKIAEFIEIDHRIDEDYGVGSEQSIAQSMRVNAFINQI